MTLSLCATHGVQYDLGNGCPFCPRRELTEAYERGAADMRERAARVTLDMSLSSKMAPGERHVLNIAGEKIAALPLSAPPAGVPVDETKENVAPRCKVCGETSRYCKALGPDETRQQK